MTIDGRLREKVADVHLCDDAVGPECEVMIGRIGACLAIGFIQKHRPTLAERLRQEIKKNSTKGASGCPAK